MDGYLAVIEAKLQKMQEQLDLHGEVLADKLAAKAKADQDAADKAEAKAVKDEAKAARMKAE